MAGIVTIPAICPPRRCAMDELKPCPCGGKFREVRVTHTHLDPWTGKLGSASWALPSGYSTILKCWMCKDEDLGANQAEILSSIAKRVDRVKGIHDPMEIIQIGDQDIFAYQDHRSLNPRVVQRLTRDGDSLLARLMRRKDQIYETMPLMELQRAGCSDNVQYMISVYRFIILMDMLISNPDDTSIEDLAFRTLDELGSLGREILAKNPAMT
jgi:hypothetical protein